MELARALGEGMGPYDRVVTSTVPRAAHTAVAMGFAVDEQMPGLGRFGPGVEAELRGLGRPFQDVWLAMERSASVRAEGERVAREWRHLAAALRREQWMLVVSHSGLIELGVLSLVAHDEWARIRMGAGLDFCEGVRLHLDGESVRDHQLVRR